MTLGVVMLVHTEFGRAEQSVRLWAAIGCPVVIHVDQRVPDNRYRAFVEALADLKQVTFSARYKCEWGMWGMVAATQVAVRALLDRCAEVRHVFLASGACLPLRPVSELQAYLDDHPQTDFIESANAADVPWAVGGLQDERFLLRFPFPWKRRRRLFDAYVRLQQLVRVKRRIPDGIVPHIGSQWWCLTRQTLEAILNDPMRPDYDRYFRRVWIPDESYFQTLVRKHSTQIESRSLTLAKFDFQGKPHIFYDDHVELLARSRCFVARKIWPRANQIYRTFPRATAQDAKPNTTNIDQVFDAAVVRRTRGRHGLYMQSRFPAMERENGYTAADYTVLQGFDDIILGFQEWLTRQTGAEVHGHLFGRDRVHFSGEEPVFRGGLSDHPRLRDYNANMFLTNLVWTGQGRHQCFLYGPQDSPKIEWMLAKDTNARVTVITGAWAVPLFLRGEPAASCRDEAARLQRQEHEFLGVLRSPYAKANIRICNLSDFCHAPRDILQDIVDGIAGHRATAMLELPPIVDLSGFGAFLQDLRNQGMHPLLTGEFSAQVGASGNKITKIYPGAAE